MADLKEKGKTKKADLKSKIKTKAMHTKPANLEKKSSPNGPNQEHASWLFSNELSLLARKKIKKKTVHSNGKCPHAYLPQNCFLKLPDSYYKLWITTHHFDMQPSLSPPIQLCKAPKISCPISVLWRSTKLIQLSFKEFWVKENKILATEYYIIAILLLRWLQKLLLTTT